jgi:branched-chain amino acid transport system ATP-binding protein
MSLLEVRNIQAYYGATQALFDVSLSLEQGEVLALMGRNGMGKSTVVKTICRMLPLAQGSLSFTGADIGAMPSFRAARLGLGLVPEGRRCFSNLTVEENLLSAARKGPWDLASVAKLFPCLSERKNQSARQLSGGEQQMLAIGRALMTNPKLLSMDEATEGLAPIVRQEIWAAIAQLKRETGLAILVIDKSLKELSAITDKAVILERGCSVWSGAISDLDQDLSQRYLGV